MDNNLKGVDMVVGAKGSPLQLVLSAVYHIDAPTGNIPYEEVMKLEKNRLVSSVIPLAYGDSYKGFRIVGSTDQYPELYHANIFKGRLWQDHFEVTVGAAVAEKLGLKVGDQFHGSHGLVEGGEAHHDHSYHVVGILDYTNAVVDQLLLTSMESVWDMHAHEDENHGHSEHEEDEREVTAALVKFANPMAMIQLPRKINDKTNMQAAVPAYEMDRLFGFLGIGANTIKLIGIFIIVVSAFSVFISLYKGFKEREVEMALMRSYGAARWQLVQLVLQEALILTLCSFFIALFLNRLLLWSLSSVLEMNFHYKLWQNLEWAGELWLFLAAVGIAVTAALLPAVRAFHINISKTLADA
ncbi:ABC transporter permease [Fulvivirga ligni]|uniref:ABC transporter permease n=1 Tax=Fulvivirga ligni TaxID=2904246 RepID=UPI001F2264D9|nr:FtsX-like permease family protein [Fulvivirga ligni]UII21269.1 ABC transporter permease [Fulvivirga ligni]